MYFRKSHVCANKLDVQETDNSSTEAEIISLDAGLLMDSIPALTLWDLVIEVFHSVPNRTDGPEREPWGKSVRSCQAKHAELHPNQAHQRHSN